jgi:hypothetical protein
MLRAENSGDSTMRLLPLILATFALASCSTPDTVATTAPVSPTACSVDADCTVKNVGNCCGEYLQCVNVAHEPDPAGVKAACEREGRSSICGAPDISGCQCIDGQCAAGASNDALRLNQ